MPLAGKLAEPAQRGPQCTTQQLLDSLDPDDRTALVGWLSNPLIRYSQIADTLRQEGYRLDAGSIARHAKGKCLCGEPLR